MPRYEIQRISHQIQPDSSTSPFSGGTDWDSAPWNSAEALRISYFHPDSKSTYPQTFCKALYDDSFLYWTFSVKDRWVRAQYLEYQDPVCRDSCVEFFVQPIPEAGYFNFEVNCIGTLQLFYIEDPTRTETGFKKATPISVADASGIQIWTSIQKRPYLPENDSSMEWRMDAVVPFSLFSKQVPGFTSPCPGTAWRGNFYKCADDSSHPHWASWAPIGAELNFHVPQYFGSLEFA